MSEIDTTRVGAHADAAPASEPALPAVLLVDDQPARLLTCESILEGVGVTCVRALSGKEALERLLRQTFAVILLDVSMPEMDGFETARLIRSHPRFERTPIIFVTGVHVSEIDTLRGYEVGAIDYISIPIVPEILRSKVALLVELWRRRGELELLTRERAEREWLSAVLNSMNEEVYFTDTQRRYTYANPAALREFGHATVEGTPVEQIVSGLEVLRADGTPRPLEEAPPLRALSGEVVRDEEQIVRVPRSGQLRHRQVSSAPVRGADGTIIGSVSVVRDITEKRQIEKAMAADLKDTRLLHDLAARLVAEGDVPTLFEDILVAAMTITAADCGTIQLLDEDSQELRFVAHRGFTPELTSHFARVSASSLSPCGVALASGQRTVMSFDPAAGEDPDGSVKIHFDYGLLRAQSTPLISRSGRPLGMFSTHWRTAHELSEREIRFLDLLARQAADLVERTQAEEALRLSEHQLRDADRRKDEFIAMLAHELRNPLVPIRTGVELLKSAREQPGLIDTIRPMMERQIGHMVRLIDDLLDVSRITSGKIELQREPVTLSSVIGSAIEANRAAISAGQLDLAVNLDEPHLVLDVDPTRFVQVISNLVQNATKFTGPGGRIAITATVDSASRPGGVPELVLKVTDSGVGISPEILPRVFDLFAQASTTGQGRHAGLGIGLALARRLIEMHGGTIEGRSEGADRGSEFTIRMPAPRDLQSRQAVHARGQAVLAGVRILIVDDNRDAADVMAILVEGMGGVAKVAYDGTAAVAVVAEFVPSVVLLDIGMPGMDGYEVCRRIRVMRGTNVSIVALSGWGQEQDKRAALQAGFDSHLTKPADPLKLEETLTTLSRRVVTNAQASGVRLPA